MHRGHAVAAALLAGRNDQVLPVLHAAAGAILAQPDHTAPRRQGQDLRHAELHRLLDREIHPLTAADPLREHHPSWASTSRAACAVTRTETPDLEMLRIAPIPFAAVAIE